MKIVFLDAATMGDVSFSPISALGDLECFQTSENVAYNPENIQAGIGNRC